jgi:hypothetical protein
VSQGQPCWCSHRSTARWPRCAAAQDASLFKGQPCWLAYFSTSRWLPSKGSPACAPTAASPSGRPPPLPCTLPHPRGSPAGAATAAPASGHLMRRRLPHTHEWGSQPGVATAAPRDGHAALLSRKPSRPGRGPARAAIAAPPGDHLTAECRFHRPALLVPWLCCAAAPSTCTAPPAPATVAPLRCSAWMRPPAPRAVALPTRATCGSARRPRRSARRAVGAGTRGPAGRGRWRPRAPRRRRRPAPPRRARLRRHGLVRWRPRAPASDWGPRGLAAPFGAGGAPPGARCRDLRFSPSRHARAAGDSRGGGFGALESWHWTGPSRWARRY